MINLKDIFAFVLLLLLGGSTLMAQKETPPEGGVPKDFVLPAKQVGHLDNGLQYTLVDYGAIPKVTVRLIVKTGNIHEGPDQVWLSDLTGNLMKEGTSTRDAKTISLEIAEMGGELNVSVGPNRTTISGSVLSEFGPQLVQLIGDVALNPAFPETEIERLKGDLKRKLSIDRSRPQPIALEKFRQLIYPDHSYGRIFPTDEMIEAYSIELVKGFYKDNFGALRSNLYVVGKFNSSAVERAIQASFAPWVKGPEVEYEIATTSTSTDLVVIDRPEAPQSTIILGLPVIGPADPDYLPLEITNSLLGGSFGSRITRNIREDKGYTYSPYSRIYSGVGVGVWAQQADVTSDVTGASLKEISYEITRMREEAPSAEELQGILNYNAGIFVLRNSSPGGIINQLFYMELHGLDDTYLTDRVKNIFAVTPEQVQEMAQKYLEYDKMTLVVVGDKESIDKQIAELERIREDL